MSEDVRPENVQELKIPNVHLWDNLVTSALEHLDRMRDERLQSTDSPTSHALETRLKTFDRAFLAIPQAFHLTHPPATEFVKGAWGKREKIRATGAMTSDIARYRVSPRISAEKSHFTGRITYGSRHSYDAIGYFRRHYDREKYPKDIEPCSLDAPYGYVLEYKNDEGRWEIIALASAIPDFERGELLVDQLQGGHGMPEKREKPFSKEARRAKMKFTNAGFIPFLAMTELARLMGLRVGLRDPHTMGWHRANPRIIDEKASIYYQVIDRFDMIRDQRKPYFFLDTNKKE